MSQSLASWSQRKIRLSKETPSVKVCGLRRCPIREAWRGRKSEAHLIADNLFIYPVRVKYPLIVPKYSLFVNQLSLVGTFMYLDCPAPANKGYFFYPLLEGHVVNRGAPLHGGGKACLFYGSGS